MPTLAPAHPSAKSASSAVSSPAAAAAKPAMPLRININGKFYDKPDAKVSVYDHGLLYGDGVFEGIRVYAGKVFRLHEHVERLYESAKHILLEIPWTPQKMIEETLRTVEANKKQDGYIRTVVTRGVGSLGIDPNKCG